MEITQQIKIIEDKLINKQLINNPHECAELRSSLSGIYSYIVGLLEQIKTRKPMIWLQMRKEHKSDSATDKAYDMTEDGMDEARLKGTLKRCDKLLSGLSSLIRLAENEARNIH